MHRFVCAAALLWAAGGLGAQSFSIVDAVRTAGEKYPAVRASLEQVSVADAQVRLARLSYLPRADFLAQVNRATRNNVFGLLLPQPIIPSISGPVLGTNTLTNAWGSAVGALFSWEPFDFGLRRANVDAADATRSRAQAAAARTRFEVETAAADAFLTLVAAGEARRAAEAALERARVIERIVGALVKAELRPGAEASRARAEVALAETQVAQADQAVDVSRAALSVEFSYREPEERDRQLAQQLKSQAGELERQSAAKQELLARRVAEVSSAEAQLKDAHASYEQAEKRAEDLGALTGFRGERLSLLDPGVEPERPSSPNTPLNVVVALALGTILSLLYVTVEYSFGEQRAEAVREARWASPRE